MSIIEVYVDGGCRGNNKKENIGGYGATLSYSGHTKEIYQGYRNTTNNRMEITAAVEALKTLIRVDIPVKVYTDSAYLCNCIQKGWYKNWLNNGWVTSSKKPVENRDLWIELIDQIDRFSFISFLKVKGHSGNKGNERADQLANIAMDSLI